MSRLNVSNLFNENEDGAPVVSGISTFSSPNYFVPPSGSTAQRPSSPGEGMIRFNTDSGHLEYYSGELWVDVIVNNNELGGGTGSNTGTGVRGIQAGGFSPSPLNAVHNVIQYITISTLGDAQDFGDLVDTAAAPGGVASRTRGIVAGGGAAPTNTGNNVISAITISSTGDATDFGDLVQKNRSQGSVGNQTRGIFAGGVDQPNADINVIQYITIASSGNSVDFGDISAAKEYLNTGQVNSAVRGIFAGGYNGPATFFNTIEYVTISTTGNSQDFGDLTQARSRSAGVCNSTRGILLGGGTPTRVNTIDFITITSTGNAQDFGDTSQAIMQTPGASSPTRGVFMGGTYTPSPYYTNTIEYVTIAQTGNSVDFGDLIFGNSLGTGISNGHGGL